MLLDKPKHYIFLIHGISGNKTHFGYMVKALRRLLNSKDSETKYIIKNIEYDTGNDEKVPYDFAKDLADKINDTTRSIFFKKTDKISLIMHSQGGLVGSIWMFQSMLNNPEYSPKETIQQVDAFITLGTPFWGAKVAQWGYELKVLAKRLRIKIPLAFGEQELSQMSFGSDMINDLRQAIIDPQYAPIIHELKHNIRFLNIVGVADILNPLGIFVSGVGQYEDDGAVPLASARFNFLYTQSIKDVYEKNDRTLISNTKEIDMAPYVVVNAMHRSPAPERENLFGIAQIPKKCIDDEHYRHPTYEYIWKHLLGESITQLDTRLGDFKTFLIDINIRVEGGSTGRCDDIQIHMTQLNGEPLSSSNIEVSRAVELYSKGQRQSIESPDQFRYYFTGHIKKSLENRQEAVLLHLIKKGYKSRLIEVELKASYSSFVDINLIKE